MIRWLRRSLLLWTLLFSLDSLSRPAFAGSMTRIEENDPSIAYSGNWNSNSNANHSGGRALLTNATGARAVVTFTGSGITWIGLAERWNGMATIIVDGRMYKIDGWAADTRYQHVLFSISGLPVGPHKMSIEITHERGPNGEGSWVWIDGFDIEDGGGLKGGIAVPGAGRIENDHPALTYTGNWNSNLQPTHSGQTAALAVDPGSSVTLTFNGTGAAWLAHRDQWSGVAQVFVDGEPAANVDTWSPHGEPRSEAYRVEGLTPGIHTLKIQVAGARNPGSGGNWVWVDAFDVMPAASGGADSPAFAINYSSFCVGDEWMLTLTNARAHASIRLIGSSNGVPWEIPTWATTEAGGTTIFRGAFANGTQGSHTLRVAVDGRSSTTLSFVVSNCPR